MQPGIKSPADIAPGKKRTASSGPDSARPAGQAAAGAFAVFFAPFFAPRIGLWRAAAAAGLSAGILALGWAPAPAFAWWLFSSSAEEASGGQSAKAADSAASSSSPASSRPGSSPADSSAGKAAAIAASQAKARGQAGAQEPNQNSHAMRGFGAWGEGGWPEWSATNWSVVTAEAPNALGLKAAQIQKWELARKKTQEGRQTGRERQEAYQAQLRVQAQKGPAGLDPVEMARSRRALAAQREQAEEGAEDAWADFYASLDSEQQKKFVSLARERIRRWDERAKMARRWDYDSHEGPPRPELRAASKAERGAQNASRPQKAPAKTAKAPPPANAL